MANYQASDQHPVLAVNGVFSYLGDDVLGSPTAVLTAGGTLSAAQLYGPYGAGRYLYGSWPAAGGYTGQWSDGPSGLDYYVARYYDASAGQFASAGSVEADSRRHGRTYSVFPTTTALGGEDP